MIDVKEYTARNLGEQLTAIEIHLTDFLKNAGNALKEDEQDFCIECLAKHALAMGQFSKEGIQFFENDPFYKESYDKSVQLYNDTPQLNEKKASVYYYTIRSLRKQLVAMHLILSNALKNKHFPVSHIT